MQYYLDTNFFLRFLVNDHPVYSAKAINVMRKIALGQIIGVTVEAVIAEVCVVLNLKSQYNLSHEEISIKMLAILAFDGIQISQKAIYIEAITLFGKDRNLDIVDALLIAHMREEESKQMISFDRDFNRYKDIHRFEEV